MPSFDLDPIISKLLNASGPVVKKIVIAKLRPKLEPRLKKDGMGSMLPEHQGVCISCGRNA